MVVRGAPGHREPDPGQEDHPAESAQVKPGQPADLPVAVDGEQDDAACDGEKKGKAHMLLPVTISQYIM